MATFASRSFWNPLPVGLERGEIGFGLFELGLGLGNFLRPVAMLRARAAFACQLALAGAGGRSRCDSRCPRFSARTFAFLDALAFLERQAGGVVPLTFGLTRILVGRDDGQGKRVDRPADPRSGSGIRKDPHPLTECFRAFGARRGGCGNRGEGRGSGAVLFHVHRPASPIVSCDLVEGTPSPIRGTTRTAQTSAARTLSTELSTSGNCNTT